MKFGWNDGGFFSATTGYVGFVSNSYNNSIAVTGEDSTFQLATTYLGFEGSSSNHIEVLNGGTANLGKFWIGVTSNSSYNSVLVDGTNSSLTAGEFVVAHGSQFNTVTITNGAHVSADGLVIGAGTNAANNSILVTGVGSSLDASGITLGQPDHLPSFNNGLTIENDGKVTAGALTI